MAQVKPKEHIHLVNYTLFELVTKLHIQTDYRNHTFDV